MVSLLPSIANQMWGQCSHQPFLRQYQIYMVSFFLLKIWWNLFIKFSPGPPRSRPRPPPPPGPPPQIPSTNYGVPGPVAPPAPPGSSYGPPPVAPAPSYGPPIAPAPSYGPPAEEIITTPAPIIHKHVYVHIAPNEPIITTTRRPIEVPPAQKHYRIVFIKAPTSPPQEAPVIPQLPQNEEKTIV